jgi:hypothetical protein
MPRHCCLKRNRTSLCPVPLLKPGISNCVFPIRKTVGNGVNNDDSSDYITHAFPFMQSPNCMIVTLLFLYLCITFINQRSRRSRIAARCVVGLGKRMLDSFYGNGQN